MLGAVGVQGVAVENFKAALVLVIELGMGVNRGGSIAFSAA